MNKRRITKTGIGRLVYVLICVAVQVVWISVQFIKLNRYSAVTSLLSGLLALVVVLIIHGKPMNAAFKMPWIILILSLPVLGLCIYFLFGWSKPPLRVRKRFAAVDESLEPLYEQKSLILSELDEKDRLSANQSCYILNYGGYPVYKNTDTEFFSEASDGLESQLKALEQAEHFIFMEYHAIENAESFGRIKEILVEKVKQGVEVRLLYDEVGSIGFVNKKFAAQMNALGVQCRIFNPLMPVLNLFMNNRDHRKITVIDGKIGYTGGYNLADEYFNLVQPYGYWKDSGIKLTGDAVKSLTLIFLSLWNATKKTDDDYNVYIPETGYDAEGSGFVQPYADTPLDDEYMGENVYLNLIKCAKYKLYIATPYLIISDEMSRELELAAKRGVDVRIITPGIPDKKMIYRMTRSYYSVLASGGVRIYEYTPGFMHAKQVLCDTDTAIVGTINMDYRSLYHHFENAVILYGSPAIEDISADFDSMVDSSEEVTQSYRNGRSKFMRLGQYILRLAAPLL